MRTLFSRCSTPAPARPSAGRWCRAELARSISAPAFSAGDALIVVKDGTRITVVALGSGEERARLFGSCPAASGEAHLLAVCDGGRVMLRDLKTGEKRGEESFPDEIVYTRFSADGKRLLVLSAHQEMFVLDVSEISAAPAAARR